MKDKYDFYKEILKILKKCALDYGCEMVYF